MRECYTILKTTLKKKTLKTKNRCPLYCVVKHFAAGNYSDRITTGIFKREIEGDECVPVVWTLCYCNR